MIQRLATTAQRLLTWATLVVMQTGDSSILLLSPSQVIVHDKGTISVACFYQPLAVETRSLAWTVNSPVANIDRWSAAGEFNAEKKRQDRTGRGSFDKDGVGEPSPAKVLLPSNSDVDSLKVSVLPPADAIETPRRRRSVADPSTVQLREQEGDACGRLHYVISGNSTATTLRATASPAWDGCIATCSGGARGDGGDISKNSQASIGVHVYYIRSLVSELPHVTLILEEPNPDDVVDCATFVRSKPIAHYRWSRSENVGGGGGGGWLTNRSAVAVHHLSDVIPPLLTPAAGSKKRRPRRLRLLCEATNPATLDVVVVRVLLIWGSTDDIKVTKDISAARTTAALRRRVEREAATSTASTALAAGAIDYLYEQIADKSDILTPGAQDVLQNDSMISFLPLSTEAWMYMIDATADYDYLYRETTASWDAAPWSLGPSPAADLSNMDLVTTPLEPYIDLTTAGMLSSSRMLSPRRADVAAASLVAFSVIVRLAIGHEGGMPPKHERGYFDLQASGASRCPLS